jgi:hypothetical protein
VRLVPELVGLARLTPWAFLGKGNGKSENTEKKRALFSFSFNFFTRGVVKKLKSDERRK